MVQVLVWCVIWLPVGIILSCLAFGAWRPKAEPLPLPDPLSYKLGISLAALGPLLVTLRRWCWPWFWTGQTLWLTVAALLIGGLMLAAAGQWWRERGHASNRINFD